MFTMGLSMGQVFAPTQAAAFATISPAATGKASTLFNAARQVGGAIGVALLTTAIVLIGTSHVVAGHEVANLAAYRVAFLVAAAFCLAGVVSPCLSTTPTPPPPSPAAATIRTGPHERSPGSGTTPQPGQTRSHSPRER